MDESAPLTKGKICRDFKRLISTLPSWAQILQQWKYVNALTIIKEMKHPVCLLMTKRSSRLTMVALLLLLLLHDCMHLSPFWALGPFKNLLNRVKQIFKSEFKSLSVNFNSYLT